MRTTLVLDDALLRRARRRAAERNVTVSDIVNEALRALLDHSQPTAPPFAMVDLRPRSPPVRHEPADFESSTSRSSASTSSRASTTRSVRPSSSSPGPWRSSPVPGRARRGSSAIAPPTPRPPARWTSDGCCSSRSPRRPRPRWPSGSAPWASRARPRARSTRPRSRSCGISGRARRETPMPEVVADKWRLVAPLARDLPGGYRFTPTKDLIDEIEWAKSRRLTPDAYAARSRGPTRADAAGAGRAVRARLPRLRAGQGTPGSHRLRRHPRSTSSTSWRRTRRRSSRSTSDTRGSPSTSTRTRPRSRLASSSSGSGSGATSASSATRTRRSTRSRGPRPRTSAGSRIATRVPASSRSSRTTARVPRCSTWRTGCSPRPDGASDWWPRARPGPSRRSRVFATDEAERADLSPASAPSHRRGRRGHGDRRARPAQRPARAHRVRAHARVDPVRGARPAVLRPFGDQGRDRPSAPAAGRPARGGARGGGDRGLADAPGVRGRRRDPGHRGARAAGGAVDPARDRPGGGDGGWHGWRRQRPGRGRRGAGASGLRRACERGQGSPAADVPSGQGAGMGRRLPAGARGGAAAGRAGGR